MPVSIDERNASRRKRGKAEVKRFTCAGCRKTYDVAPDAYQPIADPHGDEPRRRYCSSKCAMYMHGHGMFTK